MKTLQLINITFDLTKKEKCFVEIEYEQTDFEVLNLNRVPGRSILLEEIPVIRKMPKPLSEKKNN